MTLLRADQLDTSPPEYVVEGMLPDFGVGFGYGGSYTGKSLTLGVELVLAIANGVPFFGHEAVQGSAAWCLGEGQADAGVRIKARLIREQHDRSVQAAEIARLQGQDAADAWLAALPPYTDDRMRIRTTAFQVPFTSQNEPSEELRKAADELGLIDDLRLIVLDTARRHSSLSLSNGTTSNRFMMGMSWLAAQLQCTVMAVGHPVAKGHGEVGLPGDTLFGSSDFVWRIQAGEDSTSEAPNAMIIAEKVKSGPLFPPLAYELERIQWRQPPTDPETGEDILGVPLVTVRSATVRQRADEQQLTAASLEPAPARLRKPLPEAEPVPPSRPRRRTGIKPQPPFRAVHLAPAVPETPPATVPVPVQAASPVAPVPAATPVPDPDTAERAALVAALISVPCPAGGCHAEPGASCAPGGSGIDYVRLGKMPLTVAHIDRIGVAVAKGKASLDDVLAQFDSTPEPAGQIMAGAQA